MPFTTVRRTFSRSLFNKRHSLNFKASSSSRRTFIANSARKCEERKVTLSDAQRQTIYALSTPSGKGGIAVIRVSGPDTLEVWTRLLRSPNHKREVSPKPIPWRMNRCHVVHPETEETLDDGLAVFFKGPKSFTTEDVLEIHVHSGRAIVSAVLSALARLSFCRPAEPGEFTRRAFDGGRLDLTQVEGLRDLIEADTESQRRGAMRAAAGENRARFEELRTDIIKCLSLVEALIDFGEGEDIEEGVYEQARERATLIRDKIVYHLSDSRRGEIMRAGIRLAIFGPPNAGKSSLLNFFAQRDAAIVTHIPGTTRDILELSLDIAGLPVIVSDTAGIRETEDLVESIGIERAKVAVVDSDISLLVLSLPDVNQGWPTDVIPEPFKPLVNSNTFILFNKTDLSPSPSDEALGEDVNGRAWSVSLTTGKGTSKFLEGFARALQDRYLHRGENETEAPLVTHARQRVHLESALLFLEAFLMTPKSADIVLAAEELRYASQAIGKISGLIGVEDVLDVLFRDFCVGK